MHEKLLVFVQTKLCLLSLLKTDKINDFSYEITNLMLLPPDFALRDMICPSIFSLSAPGTGHFFVSHSPNSRDFQTKKLPVVHKNSHSTAIPQRNAGSRHFEKQDYCLRLRDSPPEKRNYSGNRQLPSGTDRGLSVS